MRHDVKSPTYYPISILPNETSYVESQKTLDEGEKNSIVSGQHSKMNELKLGEVKFEPTYNTLDEI